MMLMLDFDPPPREARRFAAYFHNQGKIQPAGLAQTEPGRPELVNLALLTCERTSERVRGVFERHGHDPPHGD